MTPATRPSSAVVPHTEMQRRRRSSIEMIKEIEDALGEW